MKHQDAVMGSCWNALWSSCSGVRDLLAPLKLEFCMSKVSSVTLPTKFATLHVKKTPSFGFELIDEGIVSDVCVHKRQLQLCLLFFFLSGGSVFGLLCRVKHGEDEVFREADSWRFAPFYNPVECLGVWQLCWEADTVFFFDLGRSQMSKRLSKGGH